MGHRTALSTVEEFGLLDAAYPGRFDLGLGRSGGRPRAPQDAGAGRRRSAGHRRGRAHPERAADPAAVLPRAPARLAPLRAAEDACCSCPHARVAELHRAGRRRAGPDRRHLPVRRGRGGARGARRGRRAADLDPGQQRRRERRGGRRERPAVRRELPRQPGDGAGSGRRATGPPSRRRPSSTAPTSACRPTWSSPPPRREARELADRLRALGAQHPHRRGRDPVPDPGRGPPPRVDRRRPRAGRRPDRDPVRRLARARSPTSSNSCATPPRPTS